MFKYDESQVKEGAGNSAWISEPGRYTLRITGAGEGTRRGVAQVTAMCEDARGRKIRLAVDVEGEYVWKAHLLCKVLGINGFAKPEDLNGRCFDADVERQPNSDRYMQISRMHPASKQIGELPKELPPVAAYDDEAPF